jgi:N-acetylglutamate synthase-like GNAT family acetyltransferase
VGLTIRDARTDDGESLAPLLDQLGYPSSVGKLVVRVDRFAESGSDRLLVAELDGRVVGLASINVSLALEYDEPAAKLSAIVVDESCRGQGIGGALVAAIEEEARTRGCRLLFLTTANRRTETHTFYRPHGFEETGRRFAKWLQ